MKLSSRLILIVAAVVLGLSAVSGFAVYKIRETMLEERKAGMSILLQLAARQVGRYQEMEKSGKLSRDEAQRAALEAMRGLSKGDNYVFVRGGENFTTMLAHPDSRFEGKVSDGGFLPGGKIAPATRAEIAEPEDLYDGPATIDGREVRVRLAGHLDPIDGQYHLFS